MIAASHPDRRAGKLMTINAQGSIRHLRRTDLSRMFEPGDVVVANDAATLPASLAGVHEPTGRPIEVRLASWLTAFDPSRFVALLLGPGDFRTPTEKRLPPPVIAAGERLVLGPLVAVVERLLDHPRLLCLQFLNAPEAVVAGLARHGRPVQYAYVPEALKLWDVWTSLATRPVAFEPPSAGFALDWQILANWARRGVRFATLSHAAGLSSTGDPALDSRLPLDEFYDIPEIAARLVNAAKASGRRVIAVGTSVVRALETSAQTTGQVTAGRSMARGRISASWKLRAADALLTGMHQPGESHFELLQAFARDPVLLRMAREADRLGYRAHEFGDFLLLEHQKASGPGGRQSEVTSYSEGSS